MVLKSLGLDFLGDLFLQGGGGGKEEGLVFLLLLEGIVYFIIQQFTPPSPPPAPCSLSGGMGAFQCKDLNTQDSKAYI